MFHMENNMPTKPKPDSLPVFHVTNNYDPLPPSKKHDVLLGLLQWTTRELAQLKPSDPAILFTLPVDEEKPTPSEPVVAQTPQAT